MKFKVGDRIIFTAYQASNFLFMDPETFREGPLKLKGCITSLNFACTQNPNDCYSITLDTVEFDGVTFAAEHFVCGRALALEEKPILHCKVCNEQNEYAEPNQGDGSYTCYKHPR